MPKAVRFEKYGGINVLEVVEVAKPKVSGSQVLTQVKAAGINPGEAKIREGMMDAMFPATFPSGEGSDFAGIVVEVGPDVTKFKVGDEVAGYTDGRASHAQYVVTGETSLARKPKNVPWEVAGSLFVAGVTAYAAVRAVDLKPGDKAIVSGAAGGVGGIGVQLAKLQQAEVYGIAGEHDHEWLKSLGIVPISYQGDVAAHITQVVGHPDAFVDTAGKGYVKMAIDLGVSPQRIDTIIDFASAKQYGVKTDGNSAAASAGVLTKLLAQVSDGSLKVPIARTFKLEDVQEAFEFLEQQHHRGKIVLLP